MLFAERIGAERHFPSTSQLWKANIMSMTALYDIEARKSLALAYLAALRGRVSNFEYRIVEGEANSGYEFASVETAIDFANTNGFELPQELHDRAFALYKAEGCDTAELTELLADRPSLQHAAE